MPITTKVFIVTGAGNGIGQAVVRNLINRGTRVFATDLDAVGLETTTALVGAVPELRTAVLDVTDRAAVAALPAQVHAAFGQVDGLVNVAGIIQPFVRFADLTYQQIAKVMDVNFWGVVYTCQAFLPVLAERPHASLVNVASMGGFVPVPGQSAYGASKAAVKLLSEAIYAESLDTSVAVTTVFPGGIATDIASNSGAVIPGRDGSEEAVTSLTTAEDAAKQIVDAIESGRPRLRIGKDARLMDRLSRLMPRRSSELVARKMAGLLND